MPSTHRAPHHSPALPPHAILLEALRSSRNLDKGPVAPTISSDRLYDIVFDEHHDSRVCDDIPEDACTSVPRNFVLQLGARMATKLGDALSSPRLVLTWLMASLGVSPALIGVVVPLREAGSLLPQVVIGSWIRRLPVRKWVWVAGSILQGLAVVGIAVAAATMHGGGAGWTIVGLLALFSGARGVCSVTSKDLVGKTIPRTRRGRLTGLSASFAGAVTMVAGGALILAGPESIPRWLFVSLLGTAGLLWLIAALTMTRLAETRGATSGAGHTLRDALGSLTLLGRDRAFRRFVVARALLASTVLSMPFYVLLARATTGDRSSTLGLFLVSSNLATALSGFTWGRMADRSSRRVLALAGAAAGAVGVVTFFAARLGLAGAGEGRWAGAVFALLFFLLSYAHTGIRVGRKTWLVDFAPADRRASYVAVANTVIGLVLLASGSLGVLGNVLSPETVILVFAALGLAGAALALRLEDVE